MTNFAPRDVPPDANALVEALRGLGYSIPAAVADIVDNSVSAGATTIDIEFGWSGHRSFVAIRDNGSGMSESELVQAMRLGAKNPTADRAPGDLGRFGLGLKTASFSHCRRLTVASKSQGQFSCLRWDLDELARSQTGRWLLFEGPSPGSEDRIRGLADQPSGTTVLWEVLDRIVTEGYTPDDFADTVDRVAAHLAMVFHRILSEDRLKLSVNGRAIQPWDPFLTGHPAKPWQSPAAPRHTPEGRVEVQCHVLPHQDNLTADEYQRAAGPGGWTAQQGFYVYRNRRLLLAGGWLGLGTPRPWNREEAYRLARISVKLPNTADAAWKIDVRKSTARVPVTLRPWLSRLAGDTRERARRVFAYRGIPSASGKADPIVSTWKAEHGPSGVKYRIDARHPAVAAVLDRSGSERNLVHAMLRVIEETVPVQRIWLDTTEAKEMPRASFKGEAPESVANILKIIFNDMTGRQGMDAVIAKRILATTEPFEQFPDLIAALSTAETSEQTR